MNHNGGGMRSSGLKEQNFQIMIKDMKQVNFTRDDLEFLENSSQQEQVVEIKDFNAEIALKYTTKKDGISAMYATQAKLLAYITPTMAKRIVGVENFLLTAIEANIAGVWKSNIENGLFVEIKKV